MHYSDDEIKERFEFSLSRIQALNNFLLKNGFKTKFNFYESYESYFNISDLNGIDIFLYGLDKSIVNNSICLNPMLVHEDDGRDFILHLWFYTGGDEGHHFKDIRLNRDFIDTDDFFDFVLDYINDFFIDPFKKCKFEQLSLF